MIVYYRSTLFFRAYLLEDVKNQPLNTDELSAECYIKKSNDAEDVLLTFTSEDGYLSFHQETDEGSSNLMRSWLEISVDNLDLPAGDYVFYAYLLFPVPQLIEHTHLLVLNSAETEVTP